jgi:hypothetical protein
LSIKPRTLYTNQSGLIEQGGLKKSKANGHIEELQFDPRATRACTPGWDVTVIASMPQKGITMNIKPEVILGQQLALQADKFLEIIDNS